MAIGGMTYGITPLELAGAYQLYANGGTFTKPYSYTRVLDSSGNVVLQKNTTPVRVISQETAVIINRLMQKVVNEAPGTGTAAKLPNMTVAGKTGTSSNNNDQWFVGITPYYVGVVWMGYDEQQAINYTGHSYPPPIVWKNVMGPLHEGLSDPGFFDSPTWWKKPSARYPAESQPTNAPTQRWGIIKKITSPAPAPCAATTPILPTSGGTPTTRATSGASTIPAPPKILLRVPTLPTPRVPAKINKGLRHFGGGLFAALKLRNQSSSCFSTRRTRSFPRWRRIAAAQIPGT
jgi:penicillin-binding protein 1A